jgi:5-methylcytosine-specific restriction endonuclease McrA
MPAAAPKTTAPKSAALLRSCSEAVSPGEGGCGWCGEPRPPRRRTWCSDRCATRFWSDHWWSLARSAAKRRDKYRCVRCGHALPKRPSRKAYPREAAYRAALRAWRARRKLEHLEVNHIVPALGAHRTLSCVHHLANLETLCAPCHLAFTRADGAANGATMTPSTL